MNYKKTFVFISVIFALNYAVSISAMEPSDGQREALFKLCAKGDIEGVSHLVGSGVNVNAVSGRGWTPLHIASDAGHRKLVHYLVQLGADVNVLDWNGLTASDVAFENGYRDIADYLIVAEESLLKAEVTKGYSKKEARKARENANQKQNALNMQSAAFGTASPVALEPEKYEKGVVIHNGPTVGSINDYSNRLGYYNEITVLQNKGNSAAPGIYYRTPQGLKLIPASLKSNDGLSIVANQLSDLSFSDHVWGKMNIPGDTRHNFPVDLEEEFGQWGRVVIENPIDNPNQVRDSQKKFKLKITIPGRINEMDYTTGKAVLLEKNEGAFEFIVKKSLYQEKGFCTHRFFNPKILVPQRTYFHDGTSYTAGIDEDGVEERERLDRLKK